MLRLYNSLSKKKENFKPIKSKDVGFYTCGITAYNYAHIGNLRTYIFEDILKRVLLYNGYKVKHVQNVTDVGHLTSDADVGEDKLMQALKREGKPVNKKSMLELSRFYAKAFYDNCKQLNILKPDIICKATEHIRDMVNLIKKIEKKGYTYKTKVGLIYDTSKFKNYIKLGRLKLEKLKVGARVEVDPERKNPSDFALWITNQPKHIMQWDSPWGRGFPGWHIECSAMSMKYLGDHFDIHCGGVDHIQVHHTNEIAQSEGATGKKWVNYWLHGEFLVLSKKKMAKSGEMFITLQTLLDKGFSALDYRYLCLGTHYRKQLEFSYESLQNAKNSFNRLKERVLEFKKSKDNKGNMNKYEKQFEKVLDEDLNISLGLEVVWKLVRDSKVGDKLKYKWLLKFDKVLGLGLDKIKIEKFSKEILSLIKKRDKARKDKNWKESDKIREILLKKGVKVSDNPKGSIYSKGL